MSGVGAYTLPGHGCGSSPDIVISVTDALPDLAPADAAVALRSLPRRFGEAIAAAARSDSRGGSEEDVEDRAHQIGTDGTSPLEQLAAATAEITLLHHAAAVVLSGSNAALHPAVVSRHARVWDVPAGLTVAVGIELLEAEAVAFAELIESATATEWAKAGTVAGGHAVTAIGIVSDAVHSAVTRLRSIG